VFSVGTIFGESMKEFSKQILAISDNLESSLLTYKMETAATK
jgi:hypothetical protein